MKIYEMIMLRGEDPIPQYQMNCFSNNLTCFATPHSSFQPFRHQNILRLLFASSGFLARISKPFRLFPLLAVPFNLSRIEMKSFGLIFAISGFRSHLEAFRLFLSTKAPSDPIFLSVPTTLLTNCCPPVQILDPVQTHHQHRDRKNPPSCMLHRYCQSSASHRPHRRHLRSRLYRTSISHTSKCPPDTTRIQSRSSNPNSPKRRRDPRRR